MVLVSDKYLVLHSAQKLLPTRSEMSPVLISVTYTRAQTMGSPSGLPDAAAQMGMQRLAVRPDVTNETRIKFGVNA